MECPSLLACDLEILVHMADDVPNNQAFAQSQAVGVDAGQMPDGLRNHAARSTC